MTYTARDIHPSTAGPRVHGNGRSPGKPITYTAEDRAAWLAEYNAGTRRAVLANRRREFREKELDRFDAARRIRDGLTAS